MVKFFCFLLFFASREKCEEVTTMEHPTTLFSSEVQRLCMLPALKFGSHYMLSTRVSKQNVLGVFPMHSSALKQKFAILWKRGAIYFECKGVFPRRLELKHHLLQLMGPSSTRYLSMCPTAGS